MDETENSAPSQPADDGWNASAIAPDEVCLTFWQVAFGPLDDSPKRWGLVKSQIKKHTPEGARGAFLDDVYFAVWGFRNNYAEETLRVKTSDILEVERRQQSKACKQISSALESLPILGQDFKEIGEPLRLAVGEHLIYLSSRKKYTPGKGRKIEKARDILMLTLADRWCAHTKTLCEGAAWHQFIELTLAISGYKIDGQNVAHLLRHARKKYKDTRLYLRKGAMMQHAYPLGRIKGLKQVR